jgi:hypothetical protein
MKMRWINCIKHMRRMKKLCKLIVIKSLGMDPLQGPTIKVALTKISGRQMMFLSGCGLFIKGPVSE